MSTSWLAVPKPYADAVMIADPAFTPVSAGTRMGAVAPSTMMKVAGATVTFETSLLVSVMNTPPNGAAVASVTGNGTDWFGATVTFEGSTIAAADAVDAVIVTVAGLLAVKPLFTISCAT